MEMLFSNWHFLQYLHDKSSEKQPIDDVVQQGYN